MRTKYVHIRTKYDCVPSLSFHPISVSDCSQKNDTVLESPIDMTWYV